VSRALAQEPGRSVRFWADLREALAGSQQDFTEGPIGRAIALLAIPMVLEMAMESLFGVVDVYFVARLGSDAVAAVGVIETMLTLVFPVAMGLSVATSAMVARRIGEKDAAGASAAAAQGILAGLLVSILAGLAGAMFAPDLLRLMGVEPRVVALGSAYGRILLGGTGTLLMLFLMNSIFRGAGDAAIAMRVLWFANLIAIGLVPALINGWGPFPKLGLEGAAVGSTIGRGLGVLLQVWVLFGSKGRVTLRWSQLRVLSGPLLRILRTSVGGTLQYAIAHLSWLALVRIIATFGASALAGYTIAIRVIVFAILPSWGLANAAATLVGQNLGAARPARAEKAVWTTAFYNAAFLGSVALFFIVFAVPVLRLFTREPAVISTGVDCLRFICLGYPFYAFGMVMVQSFNGAGDTSTPALVNLFCYWMWEIPLAWFLARQAGLGPDGVFIAIAIAESTTACVGVLLFRRGTWKGMRI
jgi:putative MATE family efflux protein